MLSIVLMIEYVAAQAINLEKLQKGDISGFVEEVRACSAFITGSPTHLDCLHACHHGVTASAAQ